MQHLWLRKHDNALCAITYVHRRLLLPRLILVPKRSCRSACQGCLGPNARPRPLPLLPQPPVIHYSLTFYVLGMEHAF